MRKKYVLWYTFIRYIRIILGRKYEFSLLYVPIFELTKIFDFAACVCPALGQFHEEPVIRTTNNIINPIEFQPPALT